jgi:hypothetical protein
MENGDFSVIRSADEDPAAILTRDMPHLRIVPDWLWYQANRAIEERTTRKSLA